jgi:hypothetical protein
MERPARAVTARERHAGRVRGPLCHSCESRNPVFSPLPWWESTAGPEAMPKARPGERAECHSRASGNPGFFAPAPCVIESRNPGKQQLDCHFRGNGTQRPALYKRPRLLPAPSVSFLRPLCHSCESRNPVFSPLPWWESTAGPLAPPGERAECHSCPPCHSCAPCVIPAEAGIQSPSYHRGKGQWLHSANMLSTFSGIQRFLQEGAIVRDSCSRFS